MKTVYQSKDGTVFTTKEECQKHEEKKILKMKENIDIIPLKALVKTYGEYVCSDEYHEDNDYKHYIYEAVIEMFYGDDFWKIY